MIKWFLLSAIGISLLFVRRNAMKSPVKIITICFSSFLSLFLAVAGFAETRPQTLLQSQLIQAGDEMLENLEVSYVYGGSKVGSLAQCNTCNQCLESLKPSPKERLVKCKSCSGCSLDCSHFTQLVYARVGLNYPYLTTSQMMSLPAAVLEKTYQLTVVGTDIQNAQPGDLLVYPGHVVMLESRIKGGFGDVIHATGGKDIKEPGQGIQRERQAQLGQFRGSLQRILRHRRLEYERVAVLRPGVGGELQSRPVLRKMRPVEKKNP